MFGFGDLSIRDIATDPGRSIAYSSYYAGGTRELGRRHTAVPCSASVRPGIEELWNYIDAEGNSFRGVETFVLAREAAGNLEESACSRASTRDHGILSSAGRATDPIVE